MSDWELPEDPFDVSAWLGDISEETLRSMRERPVTEVLHGLLEDADLQFVYHRHSGGGSMTLVHDEEHDVFIAYIDSDKARREFAELKAELAENPQVGKPGSGGETECPDGRES